jgi:leucine dehydrogenase
MRDSLTAGCEQVLVLEGSTGAAQAVIAVHSTRLGPAHGGIRRWAYSDTAEAKRDVVALARAMTAKCAVAGVPAGGGKAVILDHPSLDRKAAYQMVGKAVEQLGGAFFTGPDVNTTAEDLRIVAGETRFVATDADDGPGDLAAATAAGVLSALLSLLDVLSIEPAGCHVVVQGLGAVGMSLCERMAELGVRMSVHDVLPDRVARAVHLFAAQAISSDAVTSTACDVFVPCALGGILTEEVASTIPARGVCGAANNIFRDAGAAEILHRRGVVVVPDFVANAGALIQGALWNLKGERVGLARLQQIGATTALVLSRAMAANRSPAAIALDLACERLEQ